jgi:hypothetical protein
MELPGVNAADADWLRAGVPRRVDWASIGDPVAAARLVADPVLTVRLCSMASVSRARRKDRSKR